MLDSLSKQVLPSLPGIQLEVVEDYTATSRCDEGYLRVRRRRLIAHYQTEHQPSLPFAYDVVERWNADAVAIVPYFFHEHEYPSVLRSSIRPPVALRPETIIETRIVLPAGTVLGEFWEIPAGLVEPHERTSQGLVECAVRELHEELGILIQAEAIQILGGPVFPSAGVIGECIHMFACEIPREGSLSAQGDGSPLEHGAKLIAVPLKLALRWCDEGLLPDAKTELGIRRFACRVSCN